MTAAHIREAGEHRMIRLRYAINGMRAGRFYPRVSWRRCIARARILRAEGISVLIDR